MTRIKLVVSDCDGTLVTPDKQLTAETKDAVARLRAAGLAFTITSSRPPFGMRMLTAPLAITLPIGAFNGSSIVMPDLAPVAENLIPQAAAKAAVAYLEKAGVDVWLFTSSAWIVANVSGHYVEHEQRTIQTAPTEVPDFDAHLGKACKIVGASTDAALLARCETELRSALGPDAHVARSQSYYLDVTPPGRDKGTFVDTLARQLGIAQDAIATIGDMPNDVPMFQCSGLSFAMGNAPDDVKARATHVTGKNSDNGFANAMWIVLASS